MITLRTRLFWICTALMYCACAASSEDAGRLWTAHIRPLFADNCFKCHGNIETKGGLSLMSPAEIFKGGTNGAVVTPGKPDESSLYKNVLPEADPHMPRKGKQLAPDDIALIKRWIEALAPAEGKEGGWKPPLPATTTQDSSLFQRTHWQPPDGTAPAQAIDSMIEKRWHELQVTPSALCDDRTFGRRVYLDVGGRIPTPEELNRFLNDKDSGKRAALVNTLLDSPDYAVRMRDVFDVVFMERGAFQSGRDRRKNPNSPELRERWLEYLEWSFRENRPWSAIAREILLARPAESKAKKELQGAAQFLYARKDNAQQMAEATGSALLGLQVKCAQCHDHPIAPEIKQAHYWGLVAAFNRSKGVDTGAGPGVAESAVGGFIKFTNLKGTSTEARVIFLDGRSLNEIWPKEGAIETETVEQYTNATKMGDGKNLKAVPIPKYSRREQLANWMTAPENPLLARTFVNRMWELLLGRGFVHPVDRMDSSRAASHLELLDWLADDFAKSGFDVKRLIRTITSTRAYQLDSKAAHANKPPQPDAFAFALDKPLTAEALARSMLVATGCDKDGAFDAAPLRKGFAEAFPDVFATENMSTLKQALFLTNNKNIDALIKAAEAKALAQIASFDDPAKVREIFVRALGREPDSDELSHSVAYLSAHKDNAVGAAGQVLWALLTGAEFRINH